MHFAVLNLCAAPDDLVEKIAEVAVRYLAIVCEAYELAPIGVEWMPDKSEAPDGYVAMALFNKPDTTGVFAYHSRDPHGRPYGRAFLDVLPDRSKILHDEQGKGESLAAALLHEMAETARDRSGREYMTSRLRDPNTGVVHQLVATEICDPVQESCSIMAARDGVTLVDVPNFVKPLWFEDGASGSIGDFDWLGQLDAPCTLAPGGYAIVNDQRNDDFDVFGRAHAIKVGHPRAPAAWRDRAKQHPASRTYQRLRRGR